MKIAIDILSIALVSAGAFFFMAGTAGLLRFPDTLTRLHALTKVDNLGLGLIVAGLLPQVGGLLHALKLISVWILVQLSGAIVSQLIAQGTQRADPRHDI
jgi:multicomponent Na+:H+ antiporter subunit G